MKFLCLGYLDSVTMDARSRAEIDAVMSQCRPHMEPLYATGQVRVDTGLEPVSKVLRRAGRKVKAVDGPYVETKEMIGGAILIEARDMEDAIRVASLHPALQVEAGEELGWGMEIRPIHYFKEPADNDLQASVALLIETYRQAVLVCDLEAFMRLYDPKVRVFDAWGVWSHEGADAWRKAVEGWFSSLGDERVRVIAEDVEVKGNAGLCTVSAIFTYAGFSAAGKELRAMQNRLSWVLERQGSDWRIVHEHTSAPISFDESKAILQRS
jgi:ketosteroid isomerase-like protein